MDAGGDIHRGVGASARLRTAAYARTYCHMRPIWRALAARVLKTMKFDTILAER